MEVLSLWSTFLSPRSRDGRMEVLRVSLESSSCPLGYVMAGWRYCVSLRSTFLYPPSCDGRMEVFAYLFGAVFLSPPSCDGRMKVLSLWSPLPVPTVMCQDRGIVCLFGVLFLSPRLCDGRMEVLRVSLEPSSCLSPPLCDGWMEVLSLWSPLPVCPHRDVMNCW